MTINPESITWNGDINITIAVSDGEYSDFTSFILSVINVNEPPVSESQSIEINEDNLENEVAFFWTAASV